MVISKTSLSVKRLFVDENRLKERVKRDSILLVILPVVIK